MAGVTSPSWNAIPYSSGFSADPGRAGRHRQVQQPGAARPAIAGHRRQHGPAARIDEQHGNRDAGRQPRQPVRHQPFGRDLQGQVERRHQPVGPRRGCHQGAQRRLGMARERQARRWQGLVAFRPGIVAEQAVAQGQRAVGVAVRAQPLGPAGDGDQQRRLRPVQCRRALAEPGLRSRAHPFQVAAERRQGQPDTENVALGEPLLQLHGAERLDQLAAQGAGAGLQQPRRLHGEGRTAGHHPPGARPLPRRAQDSTRVDPAVTVEAPVLRPHQQVEEDRRHLVGRRMQPPDAAWRGQHLQGAAVAVQYLRTRPVQPRQVRREDAVEQHEAAGRQADAERPGQR